MTALLILFFTAVASLFAGLFAKRSQLLPIVLIGVGAALVITLRELFSGNPWGNQFQDMINFDSYALGFSSLVLLTTLLIAGLSGWGFRKLEHTKGDHYALLLFSICGALTMFSFTNMVMLFLGIEILSIPLYVLAGSNRDNLSSNEAALKYFLMGSFATGILLFGMALVYGSTATFDTAGIAAALQSGVSSPGMLKLGLLLILIGLSFKVSAVPFHFWAPDVYQGSPNMVTAYMSTVVKTAGFAAFYRLFSGAFIGMADFWSIGVVGIAALTMTVSNFTAIFQTDFKRMMAYSSISHAGYLLLGVLAVGVAGSSGAMLVYLLTYSVASIMAFAIYMLVAEPSEDGSFAAFNQLGKRHPFLAFAMTFAMLSLAGIPPLAGFFGKYFLFSSVVSQYPWLVVLAVVNSAVSIYYYFKVIIAMYFSKEENTLSVEVPASVRWLLLVGLFLLTMLTVFPGFVYRLV